MDFGMEAWKKEAVTVSAVSDFSFASGNKLNSDPSMN